MRSRNSSCTNCLLMFMGFLIAVLAAGLTASIMLYLNAEESVNRLKNEANSTIGLCQQPSSSSTVRPPVPNIVPHRPDRHQIFRAMDKRLSAIFPHFTSVPAYQTSFTYDSFPTHSIITSFPKVTAITTTEKPPVSTGGSTTLKMDLFAIVRDSTGTLEHYAARQPVMQMTGEYGTTRNPAHRATRRFTNTVPPEVDRAGSFSSRKMITQKPWYY